MVTNIAISKYPTCSLLLCHRADCDHLDFLRPWSKISKYPTKNHQKETVILKGDDQTTPTRIPTRGLPCPSVDYLVDERATTNGQWPIFDQTPVALQIKTQGMGKCHPITKYQQLVFKMQREISLKQSGVRNAKHKSQIFRNPWETKTPGLRQNGFLIFTAALHFPHEKKDYYHRFKTTICVMLDIN